MNPLQDIDVKHSKKNIKAEKDPEKSTSLDGDSTCSDLNKKEIFLTKTGLSQEVKMLSYLFRIFFNYIGTNTSFIWIPSTTLHNLISF